MRIEEASTTPDTQSAARCCCCFPGILCLLRRVLLTLQQLHPSLFQPMHFARWCVLHAVRQGTKPHTQHVVETLQAAAALDNGGLFLPVRPLSPFPIHPETDPLVSQHLGKMQWVPKKWNLTSCYISCLGIHFDSFRIALNRGMQAPRWGLVSTLPCSLLCYPVARCMDEKTGVYKGRGADPTCLKGILPPFLLPQPLICPLVPPPLCSGVMRCVVV